MAEGIDPLGLVTGDSPVFSREFVAVDLLPSTALVAWVSTIGLALDYSGRSSTVSLALAGRRFADLGGGEVAAIVLATVVVAALLHPLLGSATRALRGEWDLSPVARMARRPLLRTQQARAMYWQKRGKVDGSEQTSVEKAANERWTTRYGVIRPIRLGCAWASSIAVPRASETVSPQVAVVLAGSSISASARERLADSLMQVEAATRFWLVGKIGAAFTVLLLWNTGWWTLLALVPIAVGWLAYQGAIESTVLLGMAMRDAVKQAASTTGPAQQPPESGERIGLGPT